MPYFVNPAWLAFGCAKNQTAAAGLICRKNR
jgi:hypothetical protein